MGPALRIDSHHHLWHYTPEEFDWIGEDMAALRRDFLLPQLRAELATANVDGTVAVQARQSIEETDFLWACAEEDGSPILGIVGWLPIADKTFPGLLDLYRDHLCGLRHVVQGEPAGFLDSQAFNSGIRALLGTGLVYDLLMYARQLEEAIRFVDRHPQQAFVLDHIAKPDMRGSGFDAWARDFRELAKRSNVTCKLSGMVTETDWMRWSVDELTPYYETALEAFGAERMMIGTDWPVLTAGCAYAQWWRTVEGWTESLTSEEQAAILGGNAQRVYRLKTAVADTSSFETRLETEWP